jgi:acetyltransferase-like isoleucine patch superfamily enzyme
MVKPELQMDLNDTEEQVVEEEIKVQYFWYLVVFFTIFLSSLIVPALLFMTYIYLFFLPEFLSIGSFFALFTEVKPLIGLLTMPLVVIVCYLIRLLFIGLITRIFWRFFEKRSPSKSGIIPRNIPSKTLDYYHLKSFILKYGKNSFNKGVIPWLSNWFYNFVGTSIIGKGSTLEESVLNDKFIDVGKNCYIGVNSTLASHLVEGIFGNIAYFKIKVGDNVTIAGMNQIGPGAELYDNSYLLPLATAFKHSILKGNNYYWGIPLRKIFRKKVIQYLGVTPKDLEINENINGYKDKNLLKQLKLKKHQDETIIQPSEGQPFENLSKNENKELNLTEKDLAIDFTTSSAISLVNIKFLAVYLPIFWLSGMIISIIFYTYISLVTNWLIMAFFLPTILIILWFVFIVACFLFSKLFLILINLIHKPKEGIFKAELGNNDFEFWSLRIELKKIVFWLIRNWPIPWMDILAFKWFGIKMTLSSTLHDAWSDGEFITFGRRVLIGQGSTIMSSMVVGKYLIIKSVFCDDYSIVGGHSTVAPGTILGKNAMVGAVSNTVFNQILEPDWIYLGIPVKKFKPNKYAESQREILMKRDVDEKKKFQIEHEVNIDEDKKDLL